MSIIQKEKIENYFSVKFRGEHFLETIAAMGIVGDSGIYKFVPISSKNGAIMKTYENREIIAAVLEWEIVEAEDTIVECEYIENA